MASSTRQRILIVTRNLPPLVGGMERLNWHMADELAKVADVRVIGPAGSAALAPTGVVVREAPLNPLRKFLWRARALARREARVWKPDVVLAGSGLTAPLARSAARESGARYVVYVHGLDVAVRSSIYRALWLPAIRHADRVIANSHATAELCRSIGVNPACIGIVHPGVDLPTNIKSTDAGLAAPWECGESKRTEPSDAAQRVLSPSSAIAEAGHPDASLHAHRPQSIAIDPLCSAFRKRHNLGDRPLLLSVGRLSTRKGLREFVTRALPRIFAAQPDVMLLIVGDAPRNALHANAQTPASIQAAAATSGIGAHLKFLGVITDYAELGTIYRAADVHVFPVREIPGDPEGFGMVAVEAAAHGLRTVAFATGGVVDAVAEGLSGHLVPSGDYDAFADAVLAALANCSDPRESCLGFARQFAWQVFGEHVAAQLAMANTSSHVLLCRS